MFERRHLLRRATSGGAILGGAAAVAVALVEGLYVLAVAGAAFDTVRERIAFVAYSVLVAAAAGVLAGWLGGGLAVAVRIAVAAVFPHPSQRERALTVSAHVYTLLAAPTVALAAAQIFQGRRARLIPGHDLYAVAIGFAALVAIHHAARLALDAPRRIDGSPRDTAASIALGLGALGVYLADQRSLPRLYPFFHLACTAIALGLAGFALRAAFLIAQKRGRPIGRMLDPAVALAFTLASISGGAFALRRLGRDEVQRGVAFQHTCLEAPLLDLAGRIGLLGSDARGRSDPRLAGPEALSGPAAALPVGPSFPDADVVLITVDALRADRLDSRTAPRLSSLARTGVRFEAALAQVPHTSFSLATLLTGKYVYSLTALGDDPDRHETLATVFQRDRYKTAAFYPPSVFFIDEERFADAKKTHFHFEYFKFEFMGAAGRTDQVIDFFEKEQPARAFVWAHYFDPHEPYELHEGHAPDGRPPRTDLERYDGEVHYVDQEIGRLIDWLRAHRRRVVIVLAADHGEEFNEHGGRYHGTTLFEEQVHVPLLFATLEGTGAKAALPARAIATPVGLIDVAPTLLGLAGIVPSARMRGRDLGPFLSQRPCDAACAGAHGPVFAEIGSRKLLADGSSRLICDVARDFCELYDLAVDPGETHPVRDPERVAALRERLLEWIGDQSTFERARSGIPEAERARVALSRGRLGDRAAAVEVAALLTSPASDAPGATARAESLRAEAASVLLGLPAEPATREAIEQARRSAPDDVTLQALALRLGDRRLEQPLAAWAARDGADPRVRAEAALAMAQDPATMKRALPLLIRSIAPQRLGASDGDAHEGTGLPEETERRVLAALGASHDPLAEAPLLDHLTAVRTRLEVVRALGELPSKRAIPRFLDGIATEPYVPVRAEMARVLARSRDPRAAAVLARRLATEPEPLVIGALLTALADLSAVARAGGVDLARSSSLAHDAAWLCDARGCAPKAEARLPLPLASGDAVWLVTGEGSSGAITLGPRRIEVQPALRAYSATVAEAGPPRIMTTDGIRLLAAFPRRARR